MLEIVAQVMQHYSQVVLEEAFDSKGGSTTQSSLILEEDKSLY